MANISPRRLPSAVASHAVEIYGGYGFINDNPVEKFAAPQNRKDL